MSAIREHVLSNGMTILCWHQPYLHGLEMGLYFKGGSIYETERPRASATCWSICASAVWAD